MLWALYGIRAFQASVDAGEARNEARGARLDIREVSDQLDRTTLACEAMWSILRDKLGVTDAELRIRVNEIDLGDGKLDGKLRKDIVAVCGNCKRTVSKRFAKCIYCEGELHRDAFA